MTGATIPAATVVLVRDGPGGLETLIVRRSTSTTSFAGMWVFPGGRVDGQDLVGGIGADDRSAAVRAALREVREEVGLELDAASLVRLAHWTPEIPGQLRFATWFFLAAAPPVAPVVDGSEIHEARWIAPVDALAGRDAGELGLMPPTWLTLHYLTRFASVAAVLADAARRVPFAYVSRVVKVRAQRVALWPGDAGFETRDPDASGPRHRLVLGARRWRLECDQVVGLCG